MTEQKSLELKNKAQELHNQVVNLTGQLAEQWRQMRNVLLPIYIEGLYKWIGYKSWSQYVEEVIKQPLSSINNYVIPASHLLKAGYDLAEFDDLKLSRVNEISKIIKQSGKLPEEEFQQLMEAAKRVGTRKDAKEFRDVSTTVAVNHDVEAETFIRFPIRETVSNLWELAKKVEAKLQSKRTGKSNVETYTNERLFEGIVSTYLQDSDVRFVLRSFSDEELKVLFDWAEDKIEEVKEEGVWI